MPKILSLIFFVTLLTACAETEMPAPANNPTATPVTQLQATATPSPRPPAPTPTPTATATPTVIPVTPQLPAAAPSPTPTPAVTLTAMMPVCTPPPCRANEVYYCSAKCPGGCGTTCATPTETSAQNPTQNSTLETQNFITPSPTLPPNTLGDVLVLEYHMIREPEGRWQRTPDNFRADVERLHRLGYTPANIIDLTLGFPDLPAGRKPVVLTFDDSDISQFRYLDDGSFDPDSAVGILTAFHQQHPEDWPLKGTFYVLQDVDVPERVLFGQKEAADKKLQWLVANGFEVASHTISHFDLAAGSDEQVQWQLAVSQRQLEARLPGYKVRSLSVPFGNYPVNEALLAGGVWEGEPYAYANTVMVAGGAAPSPHSAKFNPYRIPRVQALQSELDYWLGFYEQSPGFYYVSGAD